jgi:hypothetical protein
MVTRYWISFDLGLRGDYAEFYGWLDKQEAKECGDNVATLVSEKTRDEIVKELSDRLSQEKNPRVYVIDRKKGGKFVIGKRKLAPWSGYAQTVFDSGDEE